MAKFLKITLMAFAAVLLAIGLSAAKGQKTVRIATHAELKGFDPIWTTAYITRNYGYLVYDTLFALDENSEPQPQMVDKWKASEDLKTWTFTLRPGLQWSDGEDVTAEDCVASLVRWSKRDGLGQRLFENLEVITADASHTFTLKFKEAENNVLKALSKRSSSVPFMMPKLAAETDAFIPVTDTTGSGPYVYDAKESIPGTKTVFRKNVRYKPRSEPMSMAAGGKVAVADRIEWLFYPKSTDAVQALIKGKVDYLESPSTKSLPSLLNKKHIVVASTDPLGNMAMVRFNSLLPPFDKAEIRRAVLMALKQDDYMRGALGDQTYWQNCYSVFPCGTPYSNESGSDIMKTASTTAAAKALKDAGYDGTSVVILNPTDSPVLSAFTKVTAKKLRDIGMTVKVEDMDWATLLERRVSREGENGWHLFHTWWIADDVMDPLGIAFSGNAESGWYGWPQDAKLEEYRDAFAKADTEEEKLTLAAKVQERIYAIGALGILGQFFEPVAYRDNVTGITAPIQFYWNLSVN